MKAKFYVTTTETTLKANTVSELYDVLGTVDFDSIIMIESYSKAHGYTDVTLKYLSH